MKKISGFSKKQKISMVVVVMIAIMGGGVIVGNRIFGGDSLTSMADSESSDLDLYTIPGKDKVYISGKIIPKQSKEFFLTVEDGEIDKINVKDGAIVKKGDLLYSSKNTEKINQVSDLKKSLASKKSELSQASDENKGSIEEEIKGIEGEIKDLNSSAYKKVYATFAGKVYIHEESSTGEEALPIMTLETKEYYVKGSVNELDLLKIKKEQDVNINILASKIKVAGKISFIGERPLDSSNESSGYGQSTMSQYAVKIDVEDQKDLKNGFNVQGIVEVGQVEKKVPVTSIIDEGEKKYIFKIEGDVAKKMLVNVKESNEEFAIVTEGLNDGDNIARDGNDPRLIDGKNIYEKN